jgi:hypothetical protein
VLISVVPMVVEWFLARRRTMRTALPAIPVETTVDRVEAEM